MILTGIGLAIGFGGSLVLTHLLTSLLFGVDSVDPVTILCVIGILGAVALGASYIPARRAAGVDPMIALRHD
jgi:ABC-type antimicrobial peptide transport system permease subunit